MTSQTADLRRRGTTSQLRGAGGILGIELRRWFPMRAVLLTVAGLGVFALIYVPWLFSGDGTLGVLLYFSLGLWAAVLLVAVVSLSEGSMLGEIEQGTASWLVGMPIGRPAVVLGKFLAAAAGIATAVLVTGLVVYPVLLSASNAGITDFTVRQLGSTTASPIGEWGRFTTLTSFGGWLALLVALTALLVFVAAVMMLLGTLVRSRTVVFGLGLAVVAVFGALALAGDLAAASPAGLIVIIGNVAQDKSPELAVPLAATAVWTAVALALAVWRFDHRELA